MKYLTGESATALDAPRVGCAMDGMATDIHRGAAGGLRDTVFNKSRVSKGRV